VTAPDSGSARDVRTEDAFDVAAMAAWLAAVAEDAGVDLTPSPRCGSSPAASPT
jgi:hypothetical protein